MMMISRYRSLGATKTVSCARTVTGMTIAGLVVGFLVGTVFFGKEPARR